MPNPRAVEDLAKNCQGNHTAIMDPTLRICFDCARAYAQEQVAVEREACAKAAEVLGLGADAIGAGVAAGLAKDIAAAIRVRE